MYNTWQIFFDSQARFHSMHVATCVDYHIDLINEDSTGTGISDCIQDHPLGDSIGIVPNFEDDSENEIDTQGYQIAEKNSLNWDGYE